MSISRRDNHPPITSNQVEFTNLLKPKDAILEGKLTSLAIVGWRQARNLWRLLRGELRTTVSLSSMTLDMDDVQLARQWLRERDNWYRREEVDVYHRSFALWNNSSFAFSFMGGRIALSAIIHALGLVAGDEVIVPGYTCIAVWNAFRYESIRAIFSDIELQTYGLDANYIESKLTAKTKAIMIHHLYGLVARDYEKVIDIAKRHNLYVIEDCTHSTGASYKGQKVGNRGDVAFYSSEQSKIFNTIQGGMVTTNDDLIARKLREFYDAAPYPDADRIDKLLHNVLLNYYQFKHPKRWWYGDMVQLRYGEKRLLSTTQEELLGFKPEYYGQKMPAPLAALAINQLRKVDAYNNYRRLNANRWSAWCETYGYQKPLIIEDSIPVYLRYPVLVEPERKQDRSWAVRELGIKLGVWFVTPVHPVPLMLEGCPNANLAVKQCVNFPTLLA